MARLPVVTGKDAIRALNMHGFEEVRVKGSHHILKKDGHPVLVTIPVHRNETLGAGLLRSQIRAAGLTVDEFVQAL